MRPISSEFGFDRGTPIDRFYIERFLADHATVVKGRVLEIGDDSYTRQFGGDHVAIRDVLHIHAGNPKATIIGDLSNGGNIPTSTFDCAIITQTLHLIYDVRRALQTLHRILRPGGVLLATVPGVSPIAGDEWANVWYWGFTRYAVSKMFAEVFGDHAFECRAYGNVFASTCFLQGIAVEEVETAKLDYRDERHDTLLALRATK